MMMMMPNGSNSSFGPVCGGMLNFRSNGFGVTGGQRSNDLNTWRGAVENNSSLLAPLPSPW